MVVLSRDSVVQFPNRFEGLAEKEDFDLIQAMVHDGAVFRFNDGDFVGLTDIQVLTVDQTSAAATYTYNWEGSMDGQPFRIQGRGTRVLVVEGGRLQIIHEHLSRFPKP